ncbi:hypothetical protein [Mycobacterium saskatchewanense]|uniref:hypothetical protein n=1 Tax=Mycobacterium saskatchewanense TaxID=220927 RepID=UPI00114EB528|nr:hypothetical protein [Mycobacterium saskatchewanense]
MATHTVSRAREIPGLRSPERRLTRTLFVAASVTLAVLAVGNHAPAGDTGSAAAPVRLADFARTPFGGGGFAANGDDDEARLLQQQQALQQMQEAEQQEELANQEARQAEQQGLLTEQQATLSVPGG